MQALMKFMALASAPRITPACILLPVIIASLGNKDKECCRFSFL